MAMNRITLQAHRRTDMRKGELRRIRNRGDVPGVVYGPNIEATPIYVTNESFKQLKGHGRMLVSLNIEGDGQVSAMVNEIDRDMMNNFPVHIDFHAVDMSEPITTEVPIFLNGLEKVEKNKRAVIQQQTRDVLIKCLPEDVPEYIMHDISAMQVGDSTRCGDLTMPRGVELISPPGEVICSVIEAKNAAPDTDIEPKEPEIVHDQEGKGKEAVV